MTSRCSSPQNQAGTLMPAVSVIIASYNYETYLDEALHSARNQTRRDIEILIVDDGSADRSWEVAQRHAAEDSRVQVLRHPDGLNHGLPATLRLGIEAARGEHIAFLESDDIWRPDCLSLRLEALATNEAGAVFNAVQPLVMPGADTGWFDSYVPRIMQEHRDRVARLQQGPYAAFSLRNALLMENKIPTFSCIMVRRELLKEASFESPVPRWLDWWVWMQIARKTNFCFVDQPLTLWRLHPKSYNHKIAFSHYLGDGRALWNGFRREHRRAFWASGEKAAALFLTLPFWGRLVARFFMIARDRGFAETIVRIKGRLK